MTLKRSIVEESVEKLAMANCMNIMKRNDLLGRRKVFECKTCKKQFNSFQALGGHRTSHKNKLMMKPKKFECYLCGQVFAVGQALGGHMRKHRDELNQTEKKKKKKLVKSGEFAEAVRIFYLDLNLTPDENELMAGCNY